MIDFHRFTRELMWLRRRHPALRGEGVRPVLMDNGARVLAFQRWVEGTGRDVIVVASLNEFTLDGVRVPMPAAGEWLEVFNSDLYEHWVNPAVAGNGGRVQADGPPMHNLPHSARLTVPANAVIVLARDRGD
jgi:1,4-alpha-glucan branching enzyme